ncbi:MAG: flagellin FliC3 [Lachnospiraceae bacterium]|nr:flagellin FliC3 [Lachnospiraceae bacterium]
MRISYNVSAVLANNSLTKNDNKLQQSLGRLSSGLRIVNAKDDPAGLAISKRMNAQIEGIDQATRNSGDGVSIIEIADGTLSEIHDMLQRVNQLAVKASTGTLTDNDRETVDEEVQALLEEIERISNETEFNGQKILDGSFDLRGYTNDQDIKVTYYSDAVRSGIYNINALNVDFNDDGSIKEVTAFTPGTGFEEAGFTPGTAFTSNDLMDKITVDGNVISIKGEKGFELKVRVEKDNVANLQLANIEMRLEGFGSMDMQIGANEGQQLGIRIPKISLENMGLSRVDMSTQEGAREALGRMNDAIKYVSAARSGLGAYQNRLEHTISTLDISKENMTAAYSRIMDTDMAEEMTEYTTLQVMSQASTSMLAQANERPAQVLQLLQ